MSVQIVLIAIFHNSESTTTLLQDGTRNTDLLIRTLDVIEVSINLYKFFLAADNFTMFFYIYILNFFDVGT